MVVDLFQLPIDELRLPVRTMSKTAHAKFGEHEGQLASQVLQARQVPTELVTLVKVDVEREDIHKAELEVLRGRKVGVGDQVIRILLSSYVTELGKKGLDVPGAMKAHDRRRDLFPHAIHQHGGMTLTSCNAIADIPVYLLAVAPSLQEADVVHPWSRDDRLHPTRVKLVQQPAGRYGVGQDRVDTRSAHQSEILDSLDAFRELVASAVRAECAVRRPADEKLVGAVMEEFSTPCDRRGRDSLSRYVQPAALLVERLRDGKGHQSTHCPLGRQRQEDEANLRGSLIAEELRGEEP
jgi:hypothetical protein